MSSSVRVTESEAKDKTPDSRLESEVKEMSAGRKLSDILEGEKLVVRRAGGGVAESSERKVNDEVVEVEKVEEEEGQEERRGEGKVLV